MTNIDTHTEDIAPRNFAKNAWTVQQRYGWGWSVYSPDGTPGAIAPVSTAKAAEVYCEQRNAGADHATAWAEALKHGSTR